MIDIGSTDFYFDIPRLPRDELESYSTRLFDEWAAHVEGELSLPDYSLALEVEEGSLKGWGKITVTVGAIYIGIGNYGSFISGLQTIKTQVSEVSDFLAKKAETHLNKKHSKPLVHKHGGSLSKLQKLFARVQCGEMTVDQAMTAAEILLEEESDSKQDFLSSLKTALNDIPHNTEQISFDYDESEIITPIRSRPASPKPKPQLPQKFRIVVWRESKKGERKITITKM